jgi:hypothetical protein
MYSMYINIFLYYLYVCMYLDGIQVWTTVGGGKEQLGCGDMYTCDIHFMQQFMNIRIR